MDQQIIRQDIVNYCQRLHALGFLAAGDGNLSYRVEEDKVLITPRGVAKAFIHPEDIALMTLAGEVLSGSPSSESLMHLQVYRSCEQAKAVFHAHPPVSVAWSIAFPEAKQLPDNQISELILAVGSVPIVDYARPGTQQMGDHLMPYLPQNRVMILARHGALTWGEDLMEAYMGMERLEHTAKVLKSAVDLGADFSQGLEAKEVEHLYEVRKKLGDRTL